MVMCDQQRRRLRRRWILAVWSTENSPLPFVKLQHTCSFPFASRTTRPHCTLPMSSSDAVHLVDGLSGTCLYSVALQTVVSSFGLSSFEMFSDGSWCFFLLMLRRFRHALRSWNGCLVINSFCLPLAAVGWLVGRISCRSRTGMASKSNVQQQQPHRELFIIMIESFR